LIEAKGIGWRIAIDTTKEIFPILIGGDCISIELTKKEWITLVPLLIDLIDQFNVCKNKFVTDESIVLEIEKGQWKLCLEAINDLWSLKIILLGDGLIRRGFEMYWPIPSAEPFAFEMRKMWDSYQ
tara:strand:- start:289 stop:666 length:378 start_codon:yes stop_codon:yes gene_type:complete